MKRLLLFAMVCASMSFVSAQKKFDKVSKVTSSEIRWWGYKVVKTEETSHSGTVKLKSGKFNFDHTVLVDGEFVIDMRSMMAGDVSDEDQIKLTNDLKSSNFFEVKKFPIAKFHLTKIIPLANSEYNSTVYGDLTLKGVRKTISFPANVYVTQFTTSIESAKFSLNRRDFKVFYQSSLKDYFIKNEMDIQFKVTTEMLDNENRIQKKKK
ncbi:polyisoprenoid-binding protein YceI [Chryseobacterium bernardetii]|uniref:Polyisoprenoid-binding protein YceI n=3 Tax=Chryseobacterium TaxID=59732 RepID=A0A543EG32_9FLAO|nr:MULTISPECIES: YceI family protein [Chryseobacterium]MDR6370584.1 polyisoprenoid-binding protein YceI [Chryseobacterium vietnamense]MDR6441590.1 polyisoprenoid-binding protein YceI [Chryseobacterium bernardetii]MDR6457032.1 polyisoprenoid-binding protein YceI [Chryseobacterium vietnamense]MDR6485786.1 polyisoprenoid-binding protein YceI [Chryseobacterium vietnamense]TQM20542.1 polyisoprenoid-binding protein YceI [Chryseobacterium aquifrigidense]